LEVIKVDIEEFAVGMIFSVFIDVEVDGVAGWVGESFVDDSDDEFLHTLDVVGCFWHLVEVLGCDAEFLNIGDKFLLVVFG